MHLYLSLSVCLLQLVFLMERHQDSTDGNSLMSYIYILLCIHAFCLNSQSGRAAFSLLGLISVWESRCCRSLKLMPECLCRPGVLGGNMGNYPWLADSWPTTNLVHSGKEAVNCCTTNHDTAERYYNGMAAHTDGFLFSGANVENVFEFEALLS